MTQTKPTLDTKIRRSEFEPVDLSTLEHGTKIEIRTRSSNRSEYTLRILGSAFPYMTIEGGRKKDNEKIMERFTKPELFKYDGAVIIPGYTVTDIGFDYMIRGGYCKDGSLSPIEMSAVQDFTITTPDGNKTIYRLFGKRRRS